MADIFISFIHEEERIANSVAAMLRAKLHAEYQVFLSADTWQVIAGEVWLDRIREELNVARVIVLMLSPTSVGRPWVNFEAGAAWLTDKAIIPVCFNGLSKDHLPKPYSNFQSIDLRDEYYYMVRSVAEWLDRVRTGGFRRLLPMPFFNNDETVVNLHAELDRFAAD